MTSAIEVERNIESYQHRLTGSIVAGFMIPLDMSLDDLTKIHAAVEAAVNLSIEEGLDGRTRNEARADVIWGAYRTIEHAMWAAEDGAPIKDAVGHVIDDYERLIDHWKAERPVTLAD